MTTQPTPTTILRTTSSYRDVINLDASQGHVEVQGYFYLSGYAYSGAHSKISDQIPRVDGLKFNSPGMTAENMILQTLDNGRIMITFEGVQNFSVTLTSFNGSKTWFDNHYVPQAGNAVNAIYYGNVWSVNDISHGGSSAANSVTFLYDNRDNTSYGLDNSNDVINGGNQADVIFGKSGNDIIRGMEGNDRIFGDAGNDTLAGGNGSNTVDGGDGTDTASYKLASSGINVNLATGSATFSGGKDLLISIENVSGSYLKDTISGNGNANVLYGLGGSDLIDGAGGNDTIDGGGNNDTIRGGDGDDLLVGSSGSNVIDGGAGTDTVQYLFSSAAVQVNLGLSGAQNTGISTDTLTGIENLYGSNNGDTLIGNGNANEIKGHGGNDTVDGSGGNDKLYGNSGDDLVIGGIGNDSLYGGDDNDALRGDAGDDRLEGQAGNDTVIGGDGNDSLFGALGDDQLQGGAGNDSLNGGAGSDLLLGGSGNDRFTYTKDDLTPGFTWQDIITDFTTSGDKIVIAASASGGLLPTVTSGTFASWLGSHVTEDIGGNAIISMETSGSILLLGVGSEDLSFSNFIWS